MKPKPQSHGKHSEVPFHVCMDMNDKEAAYASFKNMLKKLLISMHQ